MRMLSSVYSWVFLGIFRFVRVAFVRVKVSKSTSNVAPTTKTHPKHGEQKKGRRAQRTTQTSPNSRILRDNREEGKKEKPTVAWCEWCNCDEKRQGVEMLARIAKGGRGESSSSAHVASQRVLWSAWECE